MKSAQHGRKAVDIELRTAGPNSMASAGVKEPLTGAFVTSALDGPTDEL